MPARLRSNSAPLSEDEWATMRRHPALGETLVAAVPDLRAIAPIIRQHHERYDGAGYPDKSVLTHPREADPSRADRERRGGRSSLAA